ncbi:MAG TPA: S8 family serine peptidase [Solirubrobacterales bacterium]|nr:S8 family serine peptidase [Solirubrobacterales bacterium]
MLLVRATRRAAALVAVALSLLLPGAAGAAVPVKQPGPLSPALARLAQPAVRALPAAREARVLGVAQSGPGSLIRRGRRVLVYVRHEPGAGTLSALRREGAEVVDDSPSLRTVTAAVSAADLQAIARAPGVLAVTQVRAPVLRAACDGGSVISEGVAQLNVDGAQEPPFELDGEEITVGVLSDSFEQATEAVPGGTIATKAEDDEETGDLPGPKSPCVTQKGAVDERQPYLGAEEPFDEGRGMLQIVHDVAPQADLAFHSAFNGEPSFAAGIEDLAAAGADVIVDDVGYFEEPFFQDGPVAVAVNEVTEDGATYLSSAGNDNLFDAEGNEIASWEASEYRDSAGCPPEVAALPGFNATHCMDFNPGAATDRTFGIKVEPEEVLTLDLQWAEPWEGVDTDLDAILLDSDGGVLTGSAEDNVGDTQRPIEIVQWENPSASEQTVQLVINRFSGSSDPRLKFIFLQNGGGVSGVEYPRSGGGDVVGPSIYGHAGAAGAIAVAAVPYSDSSEPEFYSSRGPVTHYFGPVEGGGPAAPIAPEELSKPEVAATDCGATTFFARLKAGVWRFCGTSAAAPHAAGVAALMLEDEPTASPEEVREAMAASAVAVGSPSEPCAVGGGLIEAVGAMEAIEGTAFPAPDPCEPPEASGAVFVAPGDWGSETPAGPPVNPVTPPTAQQPVPLPPVTRVAPSTSIARHPRTLVKTGGNGIRLVFRFRSDQADAGFLCNVDRTGFRPCAATLSRRFRLGRHVVKVKARGATGLVDPTPAVFRFRVVSAR